MSDLVVAHYARFGDLVEGIRSALERAGIEPSGVPTTALAAIDEFHVRGRVATLELIEALAIDTGSRVLDIGSGLGGPARTVAETVGCQVTGVDLVPEFCAAAAALSDWTGLGDRTEFHVGDATRLPFPDGSFHAAMTVHVAMNIPDKAGMYAEARRVLAPGGRFVLYDVLAGEGGEVLFPVPWARDPAASFLASPKEMRDLLGTAGFTILSETDSSAAGLEWFRALSTRIAESGPSPVSFAAILGEDFAPMARNQVANLAEDRIRTVTYVCR